MSGSPLPGGWHLREEMMQYSHATTVRVMGAAFGFSSRARLPEVRTPTLVLVGARNRRTHRQGREIASLVADGRFQPIPDASHLLNLDATDAFDTGPFGSSCLRRRAASAGAGPDAHAARVEGRLAMLSGRSSRTSTRVSKPSRSKRPSVLPKLAPDATSTRGE